MNGLDIIAKIKAMPDRYAVVTRFANGDKRSHPVKTIGQAENYATGERRKIGKSLINRETGATVRVVSVEIEEI